MTSSRQALLFGLTAAFLVANGPVEARHEKLASGPRTAFRGIFRDAQRPKWHHLAIVTSVAVGLLGPVVFGGSGQSRTVSLASDTAPILGTTEMVPFSVVKRTHTFGLRVDRHAEVHAQVPDGKGGLVPMIIPLGKDIDARDLRFVARDGRTDLEFTAVTRGSNHRVTMTRMRLVGTSPGTFGPAEAIPLDELPVLAPKP